MTPQRHLHSPVIGLFPLLCKEGLGEVESSTAHPRCFTGKGLSPSFPPLTKENLGPSPFPFRCQAGWGNRLPESRASGLFSVVEERLDTLSILVICSAQVSFMELTMPLVNIRQAKTHLSRLLA